jgi:hypothetical protein
MKKIVALLMVLALFSTTVFAAPLSVAASLGEPAQAKTVASSAVDEFDTLFADVQAVALTDLEASEVEGDGFFGTIFGCLAAAVTTAIVVVDLVQGNTDAASKHLAGYSLAGGLVIFVP